MTFSVWNNIFYSHCIDCGFNTLTADCEYSRSDRENLPLTIQMQLSKKPKIFFGNFIAFLIFALYFQYLLQNYDPHSLSISEITDSERRAYLNA